jgi:hypothetical protein
MFQRLEGLPLYNNLVSASSLVSHRDDG